MTEVSGLAAAGQDVNTRSRAPRKKPSGIPPAVTLIAVTKSISGRGDSAKRTTLGLREFGENYVQEFEDKSPQVCDLVDARFHLIGHLQSNKAKRAARDLPMHPDRGFGETGARLDALGAELDVMLEVKLSPEQAKAGASPEQLPELIDAVRECPNLRLLGLMTMPPWSEDPEAIAALLPRGCASWRALHELRAPLHGHVARPGGGHRGRRHVRARGDGTVRQAAEKP